MDTSQPALESATIVKEKGMLPNSAGTKTLNAVGVRVGLWSARNTSVVRISIYCRQYIIQIWNYQQCYILLSKRTSALLFVLSSFLYLTTS